MTNAQQVSPSHSAGAHLRAIIWFAILCLIISYIGGMIHFGLVYLNNLSDSTAVRIESHVQEQISEIVTEVLLNQTDALQERLRSIQIYLNHDPHITTLCIDLETVDSTVHTPPCETQANWNREAVIPIHAGSHKLGSLTLHYQLVGVFSKIFATIAPIFLFVIAIAMWVIFAIFRTAERIIIGPFADAIRKAEQQDATHKAVRMLAHDVRRPFSMLAIMLGEIKQAHTMEEITLLSKRYHMAVHKALHDITLQLNEFLVPTQKTTAPIKVAITKLLMESAETVHFLFKTHKRPEFIIQEDAVVTCIPSQLSRVFENILANAYEACGIDGNIKISLYLHNDFISLTIANSGPCIPTEDLSQIFCDSYTKGKSHGHGLGLAIAKRFVEQIGGTIRCENTKPSGVEFHMTFPKTHLSPHEVNMLTFDQNLPASAWTAQIEHKQALRLLIVEDEIIYQDALLMCVDRLNRKNPRIIPMLAQSSLEALRFAHEWQPHAIICDQNLGDDSLSGIQIAQTVQHKYPHIPILLLSNGILDTNTSTYSSMHFKNAMITSVQKPIDMGTLELFLQTIGTEDRCLSPVSSSRRNSIVPH